MARFIPNPAFQRELERQVSYVQALAQAAERAKVIAKSIARAEAYDTGDYEKSIDVEIQGEDVFLAAKDFKANWIERGAPNRTPPFRARAPLRRGAQDAGLKFTTDK